MYGIVIFWEGGVFLYKKGIIVCGKFWREILICIKILVWFEFFLGGIKFYIIDYILLDYFDFNILKGMVKVFIVNVLKFSKLLYKFWRLKLSILYENI